jgi:hypothetical protein
MTPLELSRHLFDECDAFSLNHLTPLTCKHGVMAAELADLVAASGGLLALREAGRSLEGRSINLVTFGRGPSTVLLWSQMHGDEPTATLALMDIFAFLSKSAGEPWVQRMLADVTVHVLPMLNPDGAERFRRYTSAEIDMNRDARALATPEARLLREAQRTLRPSFGFNLHDQGLSSVGSSPRVTAVSLLAPAVDEARTLPMVRVKAMRLAALTARILGQFARGHVATYDDAYEPRAFGDGMQSWGTSTLLIESGQWPGDPEKRFIRKLNYVAILTGLKAIGDGTYQDVDLDEYTSLQPNGKRMMDIIVRGAALALDSGSTATVDLGFMAQPGNLMTTEIPTAVSPYALREIGDLRDYGALVTIDASARSLSARSVAVDKTFTLNQLKDLLQL